MYADEIGAHMGLARRITKLEAKAGNVRTGKLPISVVNKVLNRTISEWEFNRWLPVIEQILVELDPTRLPSRVPPTGDCRLAREPFRQTHRMFTACNVHASSWEYGRWHD
jgi:hypothetical protein